MSELIQTAKQNWLSRIIPILENPEKISAETLGFIGETIAMFESNGIELGKKAIDYDKLVKDVKDVVELLPQSDKKEMI